MIFSHHTEVLDCLAQFKHLYDVVRIVDSQQNQVLRFDPEGSMCEESVCYDFWRREQACPNCVSERARRENNTFMKIECAGTQIYMVMAFPITLGTDTWVVELLKDVSETGILSILDTQRVHDMKHALQALNEKIITDDLTGVYNRRYLNEHLANDLYTAAKRGLPVSVLMVDIDDFKLINDQWGHTCGDDVLRRVAQCLSDGIRSSSDWVARFGGDEFFVMLRGAELKNAMLLADRLRDTIAALDLGSCCATSTSPHITVSIGVYTAAPGDMTAENLMLGADNALYDAKRAGKNRIATLS